MCSTVFEGKKLTWGWRDSSVTYRLRTLTALSEHLHGGYQLSVTTVPRASNTIPGFHGQCMHDADTHVGRTSTDKKQKL